MMRVVVLLSLLATFVLPGRSILAEGALYDPVPPAGSAFVRLHHTGADRLTVVVPGKSLELVAAYDTTPYFVLKAGQHKLSLGDVSLDLSVMEGGFYTLIHHRGEVMVLPDEVSDNPAKATIVLYNVNIPGDIALRTEDGRIPVILDVATRTNRSREINAVRVPLSVFSNDGQRGDLGEVVLQRGGGYSVFVVLEGETIFPRLVNNRTNTRL